MANCGNGRCPHCGSCLIVEEWMLKCPRCGTVYSSELVYEHIVGKPSTYSREGQMPRRLGISGRLRRIAALRRGITWEVLGSNSKTNAERGADKDMANYVERLTKSLMETGDFSEEEARALAEAFVRHYRALRYGDGVRASLPKVGTVIEVLDSITSGRSNMEGGKYDMAIASALRRAFTTTGVYKPLIRRALRLLKAEPSDDLVGLGAKYFEMIYKHLKEAGKEAHRYVVSIAIAATAMAKVKSYNGPLTAVRLILIRSGFKNLIEELDLDKFINKIEKDAVKGETSTH